MFILIVIQFLINYCLNSVALIYTFLNQNKLSKSMYIKLLMSLAYKYHYYEQLFPRAECHKDCVVTGFNACHDAVGRDARTREGRGDAWRHTRGQYTHVGRYTRPCHPGTRHSWAGDPLPRQGHHVQQTQPLGRDTQN